MEKKSKKGIIIAIIIIVVFAAAAIIIHNVNMLKVDTSQNSESTEVTTEQVSPNDQDQDGQQDNSADQNADAKVDSQYLVNMIGQQLGAIQGYQSGKYDSMEYDNFCDAGPSLSCLKAYTNADSDEEEYAMVYFAVDGYEAEVNSECIIINACGRSSQLTPELTSDMTLSELKEKVGNVGGAAYDDYEGYYVKFQKDGYEFEYYWGFNFSGVDYSDADENTQIDYKKYANDPNSKKSYGVYVRKA